MKTFKLFKILISLKFLINSSKHTLMYYLKNEKGKYGKNLKEG